LKNACSIIYFGSWYFFVAYLRRRLITIEKKHVTYCTATRCYKYWYLFLSLFAISDGFTQKKLKNLYFLLKKRGYSF